MHKVVYPDFKKCLVNVTCSVLKHFGLSHRHPSLPVLDQALAEKEYKNIVMLVYDGMGANILEQNLPADSFLRRHMVDTITSVFPSTTAAATTTLRSGLLPIESGWNGWDVYLQELDEIVTVFRNHKKDTDIQVAPFHAAFKYMSYRSVVQQINEDTGHQAHMVFPFDDDPYTDLDDMYHRIAALCAQDGKKYIYAYYGEPDGSLHDLGGKDPEIKALLQMLDIRTEALAVQMQDTLVICLADHGHIDVREIDLSRDYPDFIALLAKTNVAGDGRACVFWVDEANKAEFVRQFEKYFAHDFMLLTKEQVLEKQLYGVGTPHANFDASIGDFVAIGIGNRYFEYKNFKRKMLSHHAGLTAQEMIVPLILVKS